MKKISLLIILCYPFLIFAQVTNFKISGKIKEANIAKFAYLSTLSHQIPISSTKIFMVSAIVNNKFEFNGTIDLEGKDYQNACVFVDERGNISKEELESKFRQLIWVVGREYGLRGIILENLDLEAESPDKMSASVIVHGGILSQQEDEKSVAYASKNKKMLTFIAKYPDSPVSFNVVSEISQPVSISTRYRFIESWGSPLELYNALSERLKNSQRGQELKRVIDQGDQP